MGYTLYIDESGEEAFSNIRNGDQKGASPWFTLGAVLINDEHKLSIEKMLTDAREILGHQKRKNWRFATLRHKQKVFLAQKYAAMPATFFGVLSNKKTIGEYGEQIKSDQWKNYNKHAKYLLEKVGRFFQENGIDRDDHQIVFEHNDRIPYSKMKNYISRSTTIPYYSESKYLQHINPQKITTMTKSKSPLLCIADGIANSLYQCCEGNELGITETRYLNELRNNFYCNTAGHIIGYGIKPIHNLFQLQIKEQDRLFLSNLKADNLHNIQKLSA